MLPLQQHHQHIGENSYCALFICLLLALSAAAAAFAFRTTKLGAKKKSELALTTTTNSDAKFEKSARKSLTRATSINLIESWRAQAESMRAEMDDADAGADVVVVVVGSKSPRAKVLKVTL